MLLAPCPDQPVTLAQCISEQRPCSLCVPAANFLANRVRRGDPQELVEAAFRARFAPDQVKTLELADSPWKGSESGSVVIVEWADFECPFCRMAMPIIDDLVKRFHSDVKLVF